MAKTIFLLIRTGGGDFGKSGVFFFFTFFGFRQKSNRMIFYSTESDSSQDFNTDSFRGSNFWPTDGHFTTKIIFFVEDLDRGQFGESAQKQKT